MTDHDHEMLVRVLAMQQAQLEVLRVIADRLGVDTVALAAVPDPKDAA